MSPRHRRLQELFALGIDLPSEEHPDFCRRHCGDDAALCAELERLLVADRSGHDSFLESPVVTTPITPSALRQGAESLAVAPPEPESIGPYRILESIGEGGMGIVYLAEQLEPVRRRVAIKVIKPGMDSQRVLARFDAERQALALMNHPGIARIHDAGTSEQGRPFFAMELVTGQPIDRFCEQHRLPTRARLELFGQVCDAVQHAHQKGVIHRDLKPSNILVHEQDGQTRAKIIDFGIARATTQPLTTLPLHTLASEAVGTFHYMSPEQADRQGADVDSRTDIYSLGVLLYQLLTGQLPFDPGTFVDTPMHEVSRILRERDPAPPSGRIRDDAVGREMATHHGTEPRSLVRTLRRELDWITMKALEKDRDRRYPTSSELAADVRRYLAGEPVLAGPPTAWYRMSKWIHRHRVVAAAVGSIVVALAAAAVVATWGLLQASAAASRSEVVSARAEELTEVLLDTLGLANPDLSTDSNATMGDLLDRLAGRLEGRYYDGVMEARFRMGFGIAYWGRGQIDAALEQLDKAHQIVAATPGVPLREQHELLWTHAWVAYMANDGREDLLWRRVATSGIAFVAERSPELALLLRQASYRMGETTDRTTDPVVVLGTILEVAGRVMSANDPRWTALGDVLCTCADPYNNSAKPYRPEVGVEFYQRCLEIYRERASLRDSNSRVGIVNAMLSRALLRAGRIQEGAALAERARNTLAQALPTGHWFPFLFQAMLGVHQGRNGDAALAITNLEAGMSRLSAVHGFSHSMSSDLLVELVPMLQGSGAAAAAEHWASELADIAARRGGPRRAFEIALQPQCDDMVALLQRLDNVAVAADDAQPLIDQILRYCRERMSGDPRRRAVAISWLALSLDRLANMLTLRTDMQPFAREVVIPALAAVADPSLATATSRNPSGFWLSFLHLYCGEPARARDFARRWHAALVAAGAAAFHQANALRTVGATELAAATDAAERAWAVTQLRRGYEDLRFWGLDPNAAVAFQQFMDACLFVGRATDGLPLARERLQMLLDSDAPSHWLNATSWCIARIPGGEPADYQLAVTASREAVRAAPGKANYLNTLGAALHRVGLDQEAVDVLQQAVALRQAAGKGPNIYDCAFLALARHRLDEGGAPGAIARLDEVLRDAGFIGSEAKLASASAVMLNPGNAALEARALADEVQRVCGVR